MKNSYFVASLSVLALASAQGAFALGTDDGQASQQPPTTAITNNTASNSATTAVSPDEVMRQVRQAMNLAVQSTDAALANAGRAASSAFANADAALQGTDHATKETVQTQILPKIAGLFQYDWNRLDRGASHDAATVIVTRPMDHKSSADLQEDLKVMDQLLRDEIRRIDSDSVHQAMGINLFRSSLLAEPMYLEDYGAIFSYHTDFPLTEADDATAKKAENSNHQPESAWDRAKAEVEAPQDGDSDAPPGRRNARHLQSQLIRSILAILPQAKHIRNLKESESVVVTIAGTNDVGKPVRLTIKAKKADIDKAAGGELKPEDFKARAVWTIN